jgi:signal peptidase
VEKDTRNLLVAAVAVMALFGAAYIGIVIYAGTSSPFYTVESGSMMHSSDSKIGIIDTGDMVIIKNPANVTIVTYVEGHGSGYAKFGSYGDVILYERPGAVSVIHRAILWVGYNADGTRDISQLYGFTGDWYLNGVPGDTVAADDLESAAGELRFENFGHTGSRNFTVALDGLGTKSGYITMGDNNSEPDQVNGISPSVINEERIVGVAAKEIPWLGCVKLVVSGTKTERMPGNSLIMLALSFIVLIGLIFGLNFVYERFVKKRKE